ncbi:MAG: 30S ribosomal protein S13 [Candidatus Levybacteria bacterium]|nr:30S ribosomal protein S13 [Candidatus Levybacteria bacterium]
MRVAGVNIPEQKRIDRALAYIYGIGPNNVIDVLKKADIDASRRLKDLSEEEIVRIQKVLDTIKTEGDLRADVVSNIKRLKEIGAYRGVRHARNLPSRGQRTRSNARTKRGKRVTIGAIRKEVAEKMGLNK